MKECEDYHSYLKQRCYEGHYRFQIRKCSDPTCCHGEPKMISWLPQPLPNPANPGHDKKFEEVYGQEPTDEQIPSILNDIRKVSVEQRLGCKSSTLSAQNVRSTVPC